MKKIIYFAILLLFFSCNSQKKELMVLSSFQIDNELPYMKYPLRVEIVDSIMVIMDLIPEDYAYHIVSYPELIYKYSVGKRGSGPGEIILTTPFQIRDGKLIVMDGNRGMLYTYSLAAGDNSEPEILDFELTTTLDFISIDDTTIIVGDYLGVNRIIKIQPNNKEGMFYISDIDKDFAPVMTPYWRGYMAYNPELESIIVATQFGDVLEKYNLKNKKMDYILGDDGGFPLQNRDIQGYTDIKWVGDDIYTIYEGSFKDGYKMPIDRKEQGADIFRIYDKDLNHKKSYKLDKKITGFAVDKKNNLLIGVTPNSDNPLLYYNLPD